MNTFELCCGYLHFPNIVDDGMITETVWKNICICNPVRACHQEPIKQCPIMWIDPRWFSKIHISNSFPILITEDVSSQVLVKSPKINYSFDQCIELTVVIMFMESTGELSVNVTNHQ